MSDDDDDDDDHFDEDVYSYLGSDMLKEYYILSQRDGLEKLQPEPMQEMKAWVMFIVDKKSKSSVVGGSRADDMFIQRIVPMRLALTLRGAAAFVDHACWNEVCAKYAAGPYSDFAMYDTLLFNFTLQKELIPRFSSSHPLSDKTNRCSCDFLKSVHGAFEGGESLRVDPSLVFFHQMNHMYFLFKKK